MPYTIYKITNTVTDKIYIGLTKGTIQNRLRTHVSSAYSKTDSKIRLHQAIRKHGVEAFRIRRLCERDTLVEAQEAEIRLIAKHEARDFKIGYNMAVGGAVMIRTPEGQKRLEQKRRRMFKKMTTEERAQLTSAANEAKRGMKESKESRKRKSEAQTERWANVSARERHSFGQAIKAGTTKSGMKRKLKALKESFSPVRQKGYKHPIGKCPHCKKEGGINALKRWHFDRCKTL